MSELALKLIKEARVKRLTRLDLGNCGLTELPDELFELVWLEELILSNQANVFDFNNKTWEEFISRNNENLNNIKSLPNNIKNLKKLTHLIINNNRDLSDLNEIRHLSKLKQLRIDSTNLYDLEPIEGLQKIEKLSLFGTKVVDLTPIYNLTNLNQLSFYATGVSNLNPLEKLINLKILYADSTHIHNLAPLANLELLELLDISNTNVDDLTPIQGLKNLNEINISKTSIRTLRPLRSLLEKNPNLKIEFKKTYFIDPPTQCAEEGNKAILRFWKELDEKNNHKNNQTKLILVGNSRLGKTSLWQFLKDKIYNEQPDSTHGIKTEIWNTEILDTEDNQNLAAHIWDFGGQEYYHATHRLFLADNAVYVLVWEKESNKQGTCLEKFKLDDDLNGEIEEVELEYFPASYWLENIQYFAGNHCPVLIVQNKVDSKVDFSPHSEGVSETADCFHLSIKNAFERFNLGKTDHAFEKFKETLLELLRKNATAFKLVKYYAQVREALEAKAKDTEYIPVSELKDIALQYDETPDLENLLAYLKSFTNTVLYFPQNEVLKDRLYLNPTHISRDIYKTLNKTVRGNNGKFDVAHIQTRLNCNVADAERFVALMREFDLIFEKQDENGIRQFITPQYLPEKDKLSKDIQFFIKRTQFESAFSIQFKSFVPRSLMLRFITNNGVLSDGETYWRNGIIYESLVTNALIKVEYNHESLTFKIEVQDKFKQAIDMQNIVEQFVKLENNDDNIKISNDGKTYIELRTIRKLQHENRKGDFYYEDEIVSLSDYDWLIQKQTTKDMMAMTLQALKNEANNYISKAKTKEAMDVVAIWAHENNREQLKRDIHLLKGQLTALNRQQTLGTLSFQEFMREQAKVNTQLLDLLSNLEDTVSNDDDSSPRPTTKGKLKILMLTANPTNQARLRLDSEHSNILQKLQKKQEQFDFVIEKGISKSEFQELTVKENPEILHFSGHGESSEYGAGGLILQDTDGKEDVLPAKGLSMLFRFFKSENITIKVAVLNACYSEEQAQAICVHVPYVIGTTLNIGDTAAIAFSTGFYYKLAENGTIEQAFNAGITRAAMDGADETNFALYKDGQKMPISF